MKTFIAFLLAAILIAVVLFAILYWLVKLDYTDAWITSISGTLAGVIVDSVRAIKKNRKQNIEIRGQNK